MSMPHLLELTPIMSPISCGLPKKVSMLHYQKIGNHGMFTICSLIVCLLIGSRLPSEKKNILVLHCNSCKRTVWSLHVSWGQKQMSQFREPYRTYFFGTYSKFFGDIWGFFYFSGIFSDFYAFPIYSQPSLQRRCWSSVICDVKVNLPL